MKKLLLLVGLGVLVPTPRFASAQTLSIDHQAVGCAVAEKFPRLEARFAPADTVAVARVLFQPENAQQWYAVAMKAEGSAFSGVLPKPKKSLKAFKYYIEVTDKALGTNRTADYTANVVGGSAECKGKLMAGALGSAAVLLQVPAGAAALPAGFASTGVVAAGSGSAVAAAGAAAGGGGGGLGTGAVVGIVAGVGAVAGGVAVAAGKSGDSSTPASSIPPTPTPAPIASVAGTWVGRAPDGWTTFESRSNCGREVHDLDLVLTQTGSSIAGTMTWTTRESFSSNVGLTQTVSLTGTVNGNAVTFPICCTSTGIAPVASGTFTSTRMTGTFTGSSCQLMPFAVNRQ